MSAPALAWGLLAALAAASPAAAEDDFSAKLRQAEALSVPAPAKAKAPVALPVRPAVTAAPAAPAAASLSPAAAVDPALQALTERLNALESFRSSLDRFKFEAFAHLRYDSQDSRVSGYNDPRGQGPFAVQAPNRVRALYARRVEAKASGTLWPQGKLVLGYDFAEGKLKDLGLEAQTGGLKLQLGQFRQKFGVEPQAGSAKVWFAERAMVYGGAQPLSPSVKLVGERAMGLHALQAFKAGPWAFSLGASAANNLSEDQAAGKNKVGSADAFAKQALDENPSFSGRLEAASGLGAFKGALGLSLARDNQNSAFLAGKAAEQRYEELLGLDLCLELPDRFKLQGEWVGANALRGDNGLDLRREGWYLQQSLQPWRFFDPTAAQVELLARLESVLPNVHRGPDYARALGAASGGLKWTFGGGKQSLLLQGTHYCVDGDFGAAAGTELWVLQQQLQF